MTDVDHVDGDDQGDGPDLLDDRLADLARLIDALAAEVDADRRELHRAIVLRLLTRLSADIHTHIAQLLDQLDAAVP